ncbi:MAG: hypothetical protein FGM32_09290 [Candidatus Kapabacteria bacterium]|nr:hypothetical protein [Candidatus Kapabacteria bacterium]
MLTSTRKIDPWLRAFIGTTLVAALAQLLLSSGDAFTARPLERIISSVGVASVYACYMAGRYFGTNKAKAAQGVFLACGLFIIVLSSLRMVDRELAEYFVSAQIILHVALSLMFIGINAGLSGVMAMNILRVRSGRTAGILEIISGLAITLMMLSVLFPWAHEIHAPICAIVAAVCQLSARR